MKEKELRPREQQVVELLLQGCDNDEISKQLNMARRTVKAHFNRLFSRFGIEWRSQTSKTGNTSI